MRKISVSILIGSLMILLIAGAADALKDKMNVTVQFKCNFLSSYMEKHGYVFIESSNKMNIFAARDAKITIRDMNDKIVGVGSADEKGEFSSYVPVHDSYKVIVSFNGHESEFIVSSSKAGNFTAYLGYFESDEVGGWIDAKLYLR